MRMSTRAWSWRRRSRVAALRRVDAGGCEGGCHDLERGRRHSAGRSPPGRWRSAPVTASVTVPVTVPVAGLMLAGVSAKLMLGVVAPALTVMGAVVVMGQILAENVVVRLVDIRRRSKGPREIEAGRKAGHDIGAGARGGADTRHACAVPRVDLNGRTQAGGRCRIGDGARDSAGLRRGPPRQQQCQHERAPDEQPRGYTSTDLLRRTGPAFSTHVISASIGLSDNRRLRHEAPRRRNDRGDCNRQFVNDARDVAVASGAEARPEVDHQVLPGAGVEIRRCARESASEAASTWRCRDRPRHPARQT